MSKAMRGLTREEQETVIRTSAADIEWDLTTADPRIIRKMAKQGYKPDHKANPWGYVSFTLPYDRITIRKAAPIKAWARSSKQLENLRRKTSQNPKEVSG